MRRSIIPPETIQNIIFLIRGKKVMFDRGLAELYCVETKALNQAVKRNLERFPGDFMFQLTEKEFKNWKSQIVTSNKEKMGLRRRPYAFTEQGVAMLSSVLNSARAIRVNIEIMRIFTRLRAMLDNHKDLRKKIKEMEAKYDYQFQIVFKEIRKLLAPPRLKPKPPIGFRV